jgi:hypothetical protein
MVTEAGTVQKLVSIIPNAPVELKICILAALDAVIDDSFLRDPGSMHIDALTHFLALSINPTNKVYCKKAASMLATIAAAEENLSDDMCTAIKRAIPILFCLLGNGDQDVRIIGANGMAELAQYSRFAINLQIRLTYFTFGAKLRPAVEEVIPQLLEQLTNVNDCARIGGIHAVAALAKYSEFGTNDQLKMLMHASSRTAGYDQQGYLSVPWASQG